MNTMLSREIAQLCDEYNIGIFSPVSPQTVADRNIYVGELTRVPEEALLILETAGPPPHTYIDAEYKVLDFWARSPHTNVAYNMLQNVQNTFHRKYSYDTLNWHIAFSHALGTIVDVDRDVEGGKLFRLSVQFICRNINNVS